MFFDKMGNKERDSETGESPIKGNYYSTNDKETKLDSDLNTSALQKMFNIQNGEKTPKKPTIFALIGLVVLGVFMFSIFGKNAQEVYIDGEKVGIITGTNFKEEKFKIFMEEALMETNGFEVRISDDIELKKIRVTGDNNISKDESIESLMKTIPYNLLAANIAVDGVIIASLETKEEAEIALDTIKKKYSNPEAKVLKEPTFVQEVEIKDRYISKDDIVNTEKAVELLSVNKEHTIKHKIKEGDTLFELAMINDLTLEEILAANTELTEETPLKLGSEVNIVTERPLLSVRTYEEAITTEVIARGTKIITNSDKLQTYSKTIDEGEDGSKEVVAKITKVNGIEEGRDVISEEVLIAAIDEKIEVGTIMIPLKAATGSFKYPVRGTLTSGYGARWGTVHKALDLACSGGTPIRASDGGTVVFAGWNGGYGNMVKIDHGNGFQTVYAHNSRNAVRVGQKVAQGEIIGYVGSTGNSTGNHVHFEIIKNGLQVNPHNYL